MELILLEQFWLADTYHLLHHNFFIALLYWELPRNELRIYF